MRPNHFFVFPDAADSGNAAGAALMALQLEGALTAPLRLAMPYFGNGFSPDRVEKLLLSSTDLEVSRAGPDDIARALTQGEVVGTFQGRMEAGPRALGNRSVSRTRATPRSRIVSTACSKDASRSSRSLRS